MAATRDKIFRWFDRGVAEGASYMVVICDTFDRVDYPVYCKSADEARSKMKSPGRTQRVMECYDLSADKDAQMKQHRAMALTV